MSRQLSLLKSEFRRLVKYKIVTIALALTVLWAAVLYLVGEESAGTFLPMFIFIDATTMSMMYVGSILYYEKQENTLKPLLVTPISVLTIVGVRVFTTIYIALQSGVLLALFAFFVLNVSINFFALILFISLIAGAHAMLGFLISLHAPDFNDLLIAIVGYMFLFAFPTLFFSIGLLPDVFETVLMISPTHGSFILIARALNEEVALWRWVFASLYLIAIMVAIYLYQVKPHYALKGVKE